MTTIEKCWYLAPITSIEGYVQGILDGVANTPEKLEHYLRTINTKKKQIDSI